MGEYLVDGTGSGFPVGATSANELKVNTSTGLDIAKGNVPGTDFVHKFGRNDAIQNATTFEAIWNGGGDYTGFNATSPEELEIFSSDAADTSDGIGARTMTMPKLLDGNFVMQEDVSVILNGTTSVYTTGSYIRCSRAIINTAGASGLNIGEITIRQSGTTANIFAVMPATYNQTMIACDTIPSGTTGYMNDYYASLSGKTQANVIVRLLMRPSGGVFNVKEELSLGGGATSYVQRNYNVPKNNIAAKTDIKMMASSDTNSTAVAAGFDLILVDN